ncbi:MAG: class I SAM-dependent methyltransferase [Zavarzinella sp.]
MANPFNEQGWTEPNGTGRQGFDLLRSKWHEVPFHSMDRMYSRQLLEIPAEQLNQLWQKALDEQRLGMNYDVRGWYYELYHQFMSGKKIIDYGSGLGFDAITFASHGAHVTCIDVVENNLKVIKRLAEHRGLQNQITTIYLEELSSLKQLNDRYDVVWCCGSMIHSPFQFTRNECQILADHLKIGGRWIELGYPEQRWLNEGKMSFEDWGDRTDGTAPWVEWKDLSKINRLLEPFQFDIVLYFEFHRSEFNWFDLIKRDTTGNLENYAQKKAVFQYSLPAETENGDVPGVENYQKRIRDLESDLAGMKNSTSWKLTAPLRAISRMIKGGK